MFLAICGVIIYHLCLRGIHIGRLNVGYMGVDVFMLLSGYGIAKSLSRNTLRQFYNNRATRILPLWTIMILSVFCINMSLRGGDNCDITAFLSNITSLSFYFEPDLLPEWYLATLLMFYALSPLLKTLLEKGGWTVLILISMAIIIKEEIWGSDRWQYANAIARFPLYLLGMTCAIKDKEDLPYSVTLPLFFLSIVFFFQNQHYLFSACAVLLLVQIANKLIDKWDSFKNRLSNWIGTHTLELYVANTISATIAHYIFHPGMHIVTKISIDTALTVGISLLLWNINSRIQKQK